MSVGALITWPYKAGGRSRRGSPKAGTTVYMKDTSSILQHHQHFTLQKLLYIDHNFFKVGNK